MKKRVVALFLAVIIVSTLCTASAFAVGNYGVNLSSSAYQSNLNPFYASGYGGSSSDGYDGECTWYAWGRAYEKLGISLPCRGHANNWTKEAADAGYSIGSEAKSNSIMVEHYSGTGHVFFVEKVENGYAYVTEGNYNGYYHEDVINLSTMKRNGWSASLNTVDYIYLDDSSHSPETSGADEVSVLSGVYVIHSALDDNEVLDIQGNSKENRANIQLYEETHNNVQKFRIIKKDGYYSIQSVYSGKWLDIHTPIEDRSNIQLWESCSSVEEKWVFEDAGNGYVYIRSLTDYYVDVKGDKGINNANIQAYHFVGNKSQKWRLENCTDYKSVDEGIYTIHSALNDNEVFDIQGNSKENRANIQLYKALNNEVQSFKIVKQDGHYNIQSVYSGKWLDIHTPIEDNSNVQLWESRSSSEEKWMFEDAGNGYVYICSLTGYYLDVQGDSGVNNANVQAYHFVGNKSQKWRLEHIHSYSSTVTEPTCAEKGYTTYICSVCGDSYVDSYTKALGHNYVNGVCTRCGEKDPDYKPPVQENPFVDVKESSVYYNAILWAYNHEPEQITGGFDPTHFVPGNPCTRAQVVTFLWRAAGCPAPASSNNPFEDVSEKQANGKDNPYYTAILWAAGEGITNGTDAIHFSPNAEVTRAQFVTLLYRFEGKPATTGSTDKFADAASIASPYRQAVAWAVENEIAGGYEDGTFRPNATCTRWAVVLFMYRDMA